MVASLVAAPAAAQDFTIVTLSADELEAILHHDPFPNLPDDFPSSFEIDAESVEGAIVLSGTIHGMRDAQAFVVQAALGNVVNETGVERTNLMVGSFNAVRGLVAVNQASGSLNSQANVQAIAVGTEGDGADLQMAAAWGVQVLGDNRVISTGGADHNVIRNSFNRGAGMVAVNQAAGTLNLQANVIALAVGVSFGPELVALSDATLAQVTGSNEIDIDETAPRSNTLEGSFNGFSGVAQVSQAAGHGNVIGQVIGVTANVRSVP